MEQWGSVQVGQHKRGGLFDPRTCQITHAVLALSSKRLWAALSRQGSEVGTKIAPNPMVKEKTLSEELLSLKKKTSWSWERMCREMHRVMGEEGPSHTTLFRYAKGRGKQPHVVIERYVREAIHKLAVEFSQQ